MNIGLIEKSIPRKPHRTRIALLIAIVLVGTVLRLYQIDDQSLWYDEAGTVTMSRAPLSQMHRYFLGGSGWFDQNPPVYFYLLHGWFYLFGSGTLEARLFSAIAGILCLPLLFLITNRLFNERVALTATLLLAMSQLGVRYSQEARNYELVLLLYLAMLYLYLLAAAKRSLVAWCACVAAAVALMGTHYYGYFAVFSLGVVLLLYRRQDRIPWAWIIGGALAASIALLPWLAFALPSQLRGIGPTDSPFTLTELIRTLNKFNNGYAAGLQDSAPRWSYPLGALLFLGPITALLAAWVRQRTEKGCHKPILLCLVMIVIPFLVITVLGLVIQTKFNSQYVAYSIAPYYVLTAAGIWSLRPKIIVAVVICAILSYSGYALRANYYIPYKENYREAVTYVESRAMPDDCYAFVHAFGQTTPIQWSVYASARPLRVIDADKESRLPPDCSRIWVISSTRELQPVRVPMRWKPLLASLDAEYTKIDHRELFWVNVELFVPMPVAQASERHG